MDFPPYLSPMEVFNTDEFLEYLDDEIRQCEVSGEVFHEELADNDKMTFAIFGTKTENPEGIRIDASFQNKYNFPLPDLTSRHPGWYFYARYYPRVASSVN